MRDVYSVTVVNRYIKQLIEGEGTLSHIYVRGEVSNCKYHTSGHIYFTLKDGGSAIACVMFSGQRIKGLKFRMTEGMQVVVFGSVSVYERTLWCGWTWQGYIGNSTDFSCTEYVYSKSAILSSGTCISCDFLFQNVFKKYQ